MQKATIPAIKEFFDVQVGQKPRHCLHGIKTALNESEVEDKQLLMEFIFLNSPFPGTHSYGFHTANGRHLINEIQYKYYEYKSNY